MQYPACTISLWKRTFAKTPTLGTMEEGPLLKGQSLGPVSFLCFPWFPASQKNTSPFSSWAGASLQPATSLGVNSKEELMIEEILYCGRVGKAAMLSRNSPVPHTVWAGVALTGWPLRVAAWTPGSLGLTSDNLRECSAICKALYY